MLIMQLLIPTLLIPLAFLLGNVSKATQDALGDVSETLKVSHFDCTSMEQNRMYSLNNVAPCKISPENIEILPASVRVYQRSYRTTVLATMCRIKVMPIRFNCGMYSHSSIVHNQATLTYDMIVDPNDCKKAEKSKEIFIKYFGSTFAAKIEEDKLLQQYFNTGTKLESDSRTSCDKRGQIKHLSVETFMMKTNLSVNFLKKEVMNTQGQVLPCGLLEGGCESTSLDPFA